MDRVLIRRFAGVAIGCLVAAAIATTTAFLSQRASATNYEGTSTGYAYANDYGANGVYIYQGHFANHESGVCDPDDPAGDWPFGTWITNISPTVVTFDGYGDLTFRTAMQLEDTGDPTCEKGHYWADWYFGRYLRTGDTCDCDNGTEVCWTGWAVSNCPQAVSWGNTWASYDK
jgi:hypothetical protein